MELNFIVATSSIIATLVLGLWRISASHSKRTDQLRRDIRADMERMEANRRADTERMEANRRVDMERMEERMEKMEENRRADMERMEARMEKMEENRRADMERMEARMEEFRHEMLAVLKELSDAVAKLDSRVSYVEGILDRRSRREVPPLDLPANL